MIMKTFTGTIDTIEPLVKGPSKKRFLRFGMKGTDYHIQWLTAVDNWPFIHLFQFRIKYAKRNKRIVKIRGTYNPRTRTISLENRHNNLFKIEE